MSSIPSSGSFLFPHACSCRCWWLDGCRAATAGLTLRHWRKQGSIWVQSLAARRRIRKVLSRNPILHTFHSSSNRRLTYSTPSKALTNQMGPVSVFATIALIAIRHARKCLPSSIVMVNDQLNYWAVVIWMVPWSQPLQIHSNHEKSITYCTVMHKAGWLRSQHWTTKHSSFPRKLQYCLPTPNQKSYHCLLPSHDFWILRNSKWG